MFRAYFIEKTQYGTQITGPKGHNWICKSEDGESRITGFAKALDRAYLEGQRSITSDVEVATTLSSLADLASIAQELPLETLQVQLQALAVRSEKARRKLDRIRALGDKDQVHKHVETVDAG